MIFQNGKANGSHRMLNWTEEAECLRKKTHLGQHWYGRNVFPSSFVCVRHCSIWTAMHKMYTFEYIGISIWCAKNSTVNVECLRLCCLWGPLNWMSRASHTQPEHSYHFPESLVSFGVRIIVLVYASYYFAHLILDKRQPLNVRASSIFLKLFQHCRNKQFF